MSPEILRARCLVLLDRLQGMDAKQVRAAIAYWAKSSEPPECGCGEIMQVHDDDGMIALRTADPAEYAFTVKWRHKSPEHGVVYRELTIWPDDRRAEWWRPT